MHFKAVEERVGGVYRSKARDGALNSLATHLYAVAGGLSASLGGGDNVLYLAALQKLDNVRVALAYSVGVARSNHVAVQHGSGSAGGVDLESELLEPACDLDYLVLVAVLYGNEHAALVVELIARRDESLEQSLAECFAIPRHSPVDFISGPSWLSTSFSFSKLNTGTLTAI